MSISFSDTAEHTHRNHLPNKKCQVNRAAHWMRRKKPQKHDSTEISFLTKQKKKQEQEKVEVKKLK